MTKVSPMPTSQLNVLRVTRELRLTSLILPGRAAYVYEEQSVASPYESTADPTSPPNTEHEPDTEVGYFNGQMVPLGLVTGNDDYASVSLALDVFIFF